MPALNPVAHLATPGGLSLLVHLVGAVASAINIKGINHVVMLATPNGLDGVVIGCLFCASSISHLHDVQDIRVSAAEHGFAPYLMVVNRSLALRRPHSGPRHLFCFVSLGRLAVRLILTYHLNVVHISKFEAPVSYSGYQPAEPIGECHESY